MHEKILTSLLKNVTGTANNSAVPMLFQRLLSLYYEILSKNNAFYARLLFFFCFEQ